MQCKSHLNLRKNRSMHDGRIYKYIVVIKNGVTCIYIYSPHNMHGTYL
jgi:hypothetical protein